MTPQGLIDIHGPVALPGDWWWLWGLGALVLIVLILGGIRRFLVFLERPEPAPIPVPAWERALAKLDELQRMRPDGKEAVKHFYFLLSGVIRSYIEERFNIRAPEMTTEEFMERVRVSPDLSVLQQQFLGNFLNISDMVKFARHEPLAVDRADVLALARRFVEGTRGAE